MPLDKGLFLLYLCTIKLKTVMVMTRGKSICNVLKTIRKQIADANEIKYEPRECHHQGECRGTCPACEAEVRYIERQLDIRRQLGWAVAIVGISAGLSALSGCGDKSKKVDNVSEEESDLTVGKVMVEPAERLDGDVEYRSPVDTAIIEKDPATIKKRTAPFKASAKELTGISEIIEEPEPSVVGRTENQLVGEIVEQMPMFQEDLKHYSIIFQRTLPILRNVKMSAFKDV